MKKTNLILVLTVLLIPLSIFAKDTCNDNDIKIKSITLKELNGFSEEIQESTINNNTINLNLKMYDVGDSSTYDITVENTSNEDYYFTKDSMKLENDYLEYSLKNDSEIIHAKEEKTIELKVLYKNQIPNENYSDTSKLIISLSDKPLNNPKTNTNHYILLIILITIIPICIKYHKKGLLLLSIFGIVSNVYATCTLNLNVEAKIEIENKEAIFLPGKEVNVKMKQLAGDDTSTVTNPYTFQNESIVSIKYSSIEPIDSNKEDKNIVSIPESPYPIYMWYDNGTIYWWSEDNHPNLNEDSSYMFNYLINLNDISGLEGYDSSNVTNMGWAFYYDSSLTNLQSLKNWDVSNVVSIQNTFSCMKSLVSVKLLSKWNISNVKNMASTFSYDSNLISLDGLESWDTSNVITMNCLFYSDISLESIIELKNWNVSKVKNMGFMFLSCYQLEEIDLSNWETSSLENLCNTFGMWSSSGDITEDGKLKKVILSEKFNTSKVTNMYALFANNTMIEDYSFLRFIDTSSATNIRQMFQRNYNLTNLEYIKDWDVSNVTSFVGMFQMNPFLEDSSAINNWNISSTANYSNMFMGTPSHPEFTKVQGTWNNGTFTPTT